MIDGSTRFVLRDPHADVLVVTNMWPDDKRPVYGIFIKRQVEALRRAGVRIDVMYIRGFQSRLAYPAAALRFAWGSVTWGRRYRLVHVHTGEAALAARCLVGPPMMATYHGDDVLGDLGGGGPISMRKRVRRGLVRFQSRLFAATSTQSHEMRAALPKLARERCDVIPCGVDVGRFVPRDRVAARRQLGWDVSELVVLFAATWPDSPRKRRWLAEAACAHASAELGPVRLHVAGSVAPEEMPILMNAADCLLHTAVLEGGPLVVKEAMMCNLPVVATPSGDATELLRQVDPSCVCAPDPAELGAALVGRLRPRRRSRARERMVATVATETEIERVLDVYQRLMKEPARSLETRGRRKESPEPKHGPEGEQRHSASVVGENELL